MTLRNPKMLCFCLHMEMRKLFDFCSVFFPTTISPFLDSLIPKNRTTNFAILGVCAEKLIDVNSSIFRSYKIYTLITTTLCSNFKN